MDQLALGLIIALVPLILAGLSYATFMQPKMARKALVILIVLDVIYFSGVYSAELGARQGYTKSLQAVAGDTIMVYNPLEEWSTGRMDSLKVYMNIRNNVNSQVYDNIIYEKDKDLAYTQSIRLYCYISFAIFIVFFILSYLFETMKLSEKLTTTTKKDVSRFNDRFNN
jgi:hypothetical protein